MLDYYDLQPFHSHLCKQYSLYITPAAPSEGQRSVCQLLQNLNRMTHGSPQHLTVEHIKLPGKLHPGLTCLPAGHSQQLRKQRLADKACAFVHATVCLLLLLSLRREQNFHAADQPESQCQDKLEFCCRQQNFLLDRAISIFSTNLNW